MATKKTKQKSSEKKKIQKRFFELNIKKVNQRGMPYNIIYRKQLEKKN